MEVVWELVARVRMRSGGCDGSEKVRMRRVGVRVDESKFSGDRWRKKKWKK